MDWLRKLQSWIYANLFLPRGDWTHMAFELWLYGVILSVWGIGLWWLGPALGFGLEVFQFFLIDRRKLHLADRVADLWGHSITVTLIWGPWSILAGVGWYLWLVVQRKLMEL